MGSFRKSLHSDRKYDAFSLYTWRRLPLHHCGRWIENHANLYHRQCPAPKVIVIPHKALPAKPPKPGFAMRQRTRMLRCPFAQAPLCLRVPACSPQVCDTHHALTSTSRCSIRTFMFSVEPALWNRATWRAPAASLLEWISPSGCGALLRPGCGKPDCHASGVSGQGWLNPNSNSEFAGPIHQTADHPVCAVCGMPIDRSLSSTYKEGPITSASKITSKSSIAPGKLRRQMTVHRGARQ